MDADSYLSVDQRSRLLTVLVPQRQNVPAADALPTRVFVARLGVPAGTAALLQIPTRRLSRLTVGAASFTQAAFTRLDLPSGGAVTPSLLADAIRDLRRGDAYVGVEWPDGVIEATVPGEIGAKLAAGSFPVGSTGFSVVSSTGASAFRLVLNPQDEDGGDPPRPMLSISADVRLTGSGTPPTLIAASLRGASPATSVRLGQIAEADPLKLFLSAEVQQGIPSDQDPAFRVLRNLAFSSPRGGLSLRLEFDAAGTLTLVDIPLVSTRPLPSPLSPLFAQP